MLYILSYLFYIQGRLFFRVRQWKRALKAYSKAVHCASTNYKALYGLGFANEKLKNYTEAEGYFRKVIEYKSTHLQKKSLTYFRLGVIKESQKKWKEALEAFEKAFDLYNSSKKPEHWIVHKLKCLHSFGAVDEYELCIQKALEERPKSLKLNKELYRYLLKRNIWWRLIEFLPKYIKLNPKDAKAYYDLGYAYNAMQKFDEAAEAFSQATQLKKDKRYFFRLGYALEQAGKIEKAQEAYAKAIQYDTTKKSKEYGIGVIFQECKLWKEAIEAYKKELEKQPKNAMLWYKLGFVYRLCYMWQEAMQALLYSLSLKWNSPDVHYQLGFVYERMRLYKEAAASYHNAIAKNTNTPDYWMYRLGYVLAKAGRYEDACKAYILINSYGHDTDIFSNAASQEILNFENYLKDVDITKADYHYTLARLYAKNGNLEKAVMAYQAAIARNENYCPEWHFRLGEVFLALGRFEDACESFSNIRVLGRPYGVDLSVFYKTQTLWQNAVYAEFLEMKPVNPKVILYESFHGVSISCNPYAIFLYLLDNEKFADFTHIWVINDEKNIPSALKSKMNVVFISRNSFLYWFYLATAKYLINNTSFPDYFIRRPEQKYLNTWHGTPLKTLGLDVPTPFFAHQNITRNFLHTTHMLSPNDFTTKILLEKYDIKELYQGLFAKTGYPRIDISLNNTDKQKDILRNKLGITNELPVVLYAPTWRGGNVSKATFDYEQFVEDIKKLSVLQCVLIFRGHYFLSENVLSKLDLNVTIADQSIDASELLSITDILITDYSSIFFDFLPLKRSILLYTYDMEQYTKERGLYFSMEDMPGRLCKDIDELINTLKLQLKTPFSPDEKYIKAMEAFCPREDGNATKRAVELFFDDSKEYVIDVGGNISVDKVLIFAGTFFQNGINVSALNLLNFLSTEKKIKPVIAVMTKDIAANKQRMEKFTELPSNIPVLGSFGTMVKSVLEKWLIDNYGSLYECKNREISYLVNLVYEREFLRLFGYTSFKAAVQFEGYSQFASQLFAAANTPLKAIFLHNDMYGEFTVKYPYLKQIFSIYNKYNLLVSVSRGVHKQNIEQLSVKYNISVEKFVYSRNLLNTEKILEEAYFTLDNDVANFIEEKKTFISSCRLSPEKGLDRLINAFTYVRHRYTNIALIIVGAGPLYNSLQNLINSLKMQQYIKLIGYKSNPFPIIKKADCFVLSSRHEGQGLVLLEAMILKKPIIATDIPPVKDVIDSGYGLVVENSEEGLIKGMMSFLDGNVLAGNFDAEKYNQEAFKSFKSLILPDSY
jgi:CDP-glycerol glycerophosphotransferase